MVRKIALAMVCCLALASTAFADKAVNYVRSGTFKKCPYRTVGDAVDSGFQNPQWSSGTATDGQTIVEVEGIVTWEGQNYRALMQFGLKPNGGFDTNGLAFNGKLMPQQFKAHFIEELCR